MPSSGTIKPWKMILLAVVAASAEAFLGNAAQTIWSPSLDHTTIFLYSIGVSVALGIVFFVVWRRRQGGANVGTTTIWTWILYFACALILLGATGYAFLKGAIDIWYLSWSVGVFVVFGTAIVGTVLVKLRESRRHGVESDGRADRLRSALHSGIFALTMVAAGSISPTLFGGDVLIGVWRVERNQGIPAYLIEVREVDNDIYRLSGGYVPDPLTDLPGFTRAVQSPFFDWSFQPTLPPTNGYCARPPGVVHWRLQGTGRWYAGKIAIRQATCAHYGWEDASLVLDDDNHGEICRTTGPLLYNVSTSTCFSIRRA
jgi:hypothetical protein